MASIPLLRLSFHHPPPKIHRTSSSSLTPTFPHQLKPTTTFTFPFPVLTTKTLKLNKSATVARMSYNPTPATDRLISSISYFLPFFNGLQYGRHLFMKYPALGSVFEPIFPLFSLYKSVPYASFVVFFALYLAVVRNESFSRFVRFNAMQAVVLDVLLVLPMLVQRIFNPGRAGLGYKLMVMGHNFIFVFVVFCFVYSLVSCLLGKTPYLPIVAEAAGRQL